MKIETVETIEDLGDGGGSRRYGGNQRTASPQSTGSILLTTCRCDHKININSIRRKRTEININDKDKQEEE